jgi:hypothetical protein
VLETLHSDRLLDAAAAQVAFDAARLRDYRCSSRTMYRLLATAGEILKSGAIRSAGGTTPRPSYWRRNATKSELRHHKLLGPAKWTYFCLYVILDIFSRSSAGCSPTPSPPPSTSRAIRHRACSITSSVIISRRFAGRQPRCATAKARRPYADYPLLRRGATMILIRNVFHLKFGKAREALALMKESLAIQKRVLADVDFSTRVLTDVTGPFYTMVLELTLANLATFEKHSPRLFGDKDFQAQQQQMMPFVESGYREVFTIVE